MPLYKAAGAAGVPVQDEGVGQGTANELNFVGAGVVASVVGGIGIVTIAGGVGSFALTNVEKDIGTLPLYSGTFDITGLSGLVANANVLVAQAAGPYTGKGDRQDEAEMDIVTATGYAVDATTIRCYWQCSPKSGPIAGNVKFNYAVG